MAYELVVAGADTVVSCTTQASAAQAEAAVGPIAQRVERTVPGTVVRVINHVGEVACSTRAR